MNYLNQNIKYLRKKFNLTQDELSVNLGVKRSLIGSYEEARAIPRIVVMQKLSQFFSVSIDELINNDLSKGFLSIKKAKGAQLRVLSTVVKEDNNEMVLLVPVKALAGYLNGYADPEYIDTLPRFSMPFPELSRERTYRVFQIKGDSMLPVPSGSYIFCEYLRDWTEIKDGKTYVVVTAEEGVVYKRVYNQIIEKKNLLLKSDNEIYNPFEVSVKSVNEIWKALGYLSFELPDGSVANLQNLSSIMKEMQKEIASLKRN